MIVCRCADGVVVPDGGGEGEEALRDAGDDAGGGATAVAFEVELAFEGVVDRLDDLPQRFEEPGAGPVRFALAGRAQQGDAGVGQGGLELAAEVVLVRDQGLACRRPVRSRSAARMSSRTCALVGLRAGEREPDRQPVQGAQQVQPQAPEVAGMARRSSRTRPIRPGPSAWPSPGTGRTPPAWSRPPTRHRPTRRSRGPARRSASRSWRPACAAACCSPAAGAGTGTSCRRWARAKRNQRDSLVWPNNACITARVSSSASDSFDAIPTFGRHGARSGWDFSRSSAARTVRSRGCPDRRPREPPGLDVGLATPILDTLAGKSHAPHQSHGLELVIQ